ncbi:uncharacterized protein LOC117240368 [Bombus vosnesenskii]|uniref:Uncharacterized protein LOC117240368 n=3 Tax=Pyrobombus TaxID=144703 RepID=A0A6J3LEE8_9HYME|nr:uncharacterized protein LOC100746585 [Bombus impatiens]XP_033200524.1 uncharacterized protein LOC117162723 [Bombus vancouverensis nearcticus]XP_033309992.1 uncharacterized protein LOC117210774 [Bombus bifarius]XP_033362269.1 uncharacterized protein LOC117240368 [Bombus vosnesenskii]
MEIKVSIVILLLLILTSDGTGFGRKRSAKCQRGNEQTLSRNEQNSTSDYYYYCDPTEFGVVQKIPYLRSCSPCDMIEIDFSSACIRCGMCLAIAEKINQTLLDVHEALPNACLNDTEIEVLLRTICDYSFQFYGLRELDGKRYISDKLPGSIMVSTSADGLWREKFRDLCHYYLDEIGEVSLYEQWQRCNNDGKLHDLSNIMCRNVHGILRDCKSMQNTEKYESPFKTYYAKVKITATYDKYGKRD